MIPISQDFLPQLERWKVPRCRITVIENWAPLDDTPLSRRSNQWAVQHNLIGRPVLLYAGTLGRKHDPGLLVELARGNPEARVVVVAEGAGADRLADWRKRPPNLVLLPLQPPEQLANVLASADVLVALLDRDAHQFSVPSKVLTYLAAGKPILAAMPRENLAARTILSAKAGIVVDSDDSAGIVVGARRLLDDVSQRERAGRAGRVYAEQRFNAERKADAFGAVLHRTARPAHSQSPPRADTA